MKDSKLFIIIQARMTSTRLPKKVLLPLCNTSVLGVLVKRLDKYKKNIIIATTNDSSGIPIVDFAKHNEIKYSQGSTENVLERYYKGAKKFNADMNTTIIRITSDCPLIDVGLLDETLEMHTNGCYDYTSNRLDRTIPVGLDIEIFSFKVLEDAYSNATEVFEKEHVTPYIYVTKRNNYKIGSYKVQDDNSKYRLTLDEEDDYLAIKEVYKKFDNNTNFSYSELITMLDNNPYIYEINQNVKQKQLEDSN